MSTKIRSANGAAPEAALDAPIEQTDRVDSSRATAPRPKWSQRRRLQIAAGTVVALVLVAVLANNIIASQYTPEGALRAYLNALQSGIATDRRKGPSLVDAASILTDAHRSPELAATLLRVHRMLRVTEAWESGSTRTMDC